MTAPTICSTAGQPVFCCLASPRPVVAGGLFDTPAAVIFPPEGAADPAGGAPAPCTSSAWCAPEAGARPGSSLLTYPRGGGLGGLLLHSGGQPPNAFRPRHLGFAPFGGHGTAVGGAGVPSADQMRHCGDGGRRPVSRSARPCRMRRAAASLTCICRRTALDPISAMSGRDPLAAGRRWSRIVAPGLQLAGGLTGRHRIPRGGQGRYCPVAPGDPGKSERPVVARRLGSPRRVCRRATPGTAAFALGCAHG